MDASGLGLQGVIVIIILLIISVMNITLVSSLLRPLYYLNLLHREKHSLINPIDKRPLTSGASVAGARSAELRRCSTLGGFLASRGFRVQSLRYGQGSRSRIWGLNRV